MHLSGIEPLTLLQTRFMCIDTPTLSPILETHIFTFATDGEAGLDCHNIRRVLAKEQSVIFQSISNAKCGGEEVPTMDPPERARTFPTEESPVVSL